MMERAIHSVVAQTPQALPLQRRATDETITLKKAAEGFEGYFIYMLLKEMQKTAGSLFGSGIGGGMYEHLFHQALADHLSGKNGFGLSSFFTQYLRPDPPRSTMSPIERSPLARGVEPLILRQNPPINKEGAE